MPTLPDNSFLQFLILHGYWFAVPIMIVEGPIAQIVMGFFASFGYFNPFVVFFFGFFSDLISDSIFYAIGYFKGEPFIARFGKYLKLTSNSIVVIRDFFRRHGGKSVFLAKILTGMVPPVFITAGLSKMNLRKFYAFAAAGGIIWSSGMVALGYFFGRQLEGSFMNIGKLLGRTGLLMVGLLATYLVYRFYLHKIVERRLRLVINNFKGGNSTNDQV